jgi:hypothetical protein
MPTHSEAEENLRVIRSLMERATIYRAISAPVALVAGIAALLGCGFIALANPQGGPGSDFLFIATWMVVLAVTAVSNAYFLWRDASNRSEVFLSPGMRAALRALIPGFLCGAVFTFVLAKDVALALPFVWMIFYGLSLLATQHFAPRSLILLGWAFLAAGLVAISIGFFGWVPSFFVFHQFYGPNLAMGATFGLFHIVYAAFTWQRKSTTTIPGVEP